MNLFNCLIDFLYRSQWWKSVTVEPATAIYFLVSDLSGQLFTNLLLQKACRNNITHEPDMNTPCDDEQRGLDFVASVNSWSHIVSTVMATILTIYLLCWSDRAGRRRKPLIILPIIGVLMQTVSNCFQTYFWQWPPIIAVYFHIAFHGFFGANPCFMYAVIIYVCDITSLENRTFRVGIVSALSLLSRPISRGSAGFLIRGIGFLHTFFICLGLLIFTLLLAVLLINDRRDTLEENTALLETMNPLKLKNIFKVLTKVRPNNGRQVLLLLFIIDLMAHFVDQGEGSVLYLYLRDRFKWNEEGYSVYQLFRSFIIITGTTFSLLILSKYYKIHDGIIGGFAAMWDTIIAAGFLYAFKSWQIYAITGADLFHGATLSIARAFQSKVVESPELGHLASLRILMDIPMSLCFTVYNTVFLETNHIYPSAFYLISATSDGTISLLYSVLCYLSRGMNLFA